MAETIAEDGLNLTHKFPPACRNDIIFAGTSELIRAGGVFTVIFSDAAVIRRRITNGELRAVVYRGLGFGGYDGCHVIKIVIAVGVNS
jgi:hypothetical protein